VGTVNAGDAGIGSAGNITIAALHVVGADNIKLGGTSAGVPVSVKRQSVSVWAACKMRARQPIKATQSINNMNDLANAKDFKPTFLSVEVIGLGDGSKPIRAHFLNQRWPGFLTGASLSCNFEIAKIET